MKLPFVNTIITLVDSIGNEVAGKVDAAGRFMVNVGNSVAPTVGTIAPTTPNNGDLWFNTSTGWDELMVYDNTRSVWLSVDSTPYMFGADSTDNAGLRSADVHTPGTGSGNQLPLDGMITRISAKSRAGLASKGFDIVDDGSRGSSVVGSFALSGNSYVNNAAAIQMAAGDSLWVNSQAAGGSANDVTVCLWVRWSV